MPTSRDRMAKLFAMHSGAAAKVAFLMTGDRQEAEDIVQDAFVKLFGRLHHLRNPDSFPYYLRRTVINLAKDRYRRRSLAQLHQQMSFDPGLGLDDRLDVRSALDRLPTRQRAAIVLRYFEGLSEAETAMVLDCSVSAVKSLVARAKATMGTELEVSVSGG